MKAKFVFAAVSMAMLAGCSAKLSNVEAFDEHAISAVQAEIKKEIGVYLRAEKLDPYYVVEVDKRRTMIPVIIKASDFQCGLGKIEYELQKINAELTTTRTKSGGGGVSFTVPIHLVTIGGGADGSKDVSNTQTLKYNVYVLGMDMQSADFQQMKPPTIEEIDGAPIAGALLNLRNSQIFGAMYKNPETGLANPYPQPCVSSADISKPTDTTNEYDLGISTTIDIKGNVSISLAVISLNASGEYKSVTGNTLSATFVPKGLRELQDMVDARDKACQPRSNVKDCNDREAKLRKAIKLHTMNSTLPNNPLTPLRGSPRLFLPQ